MTASWSPELGCWARRDDAPAYGSPADVQHPSWTFQCCALPVDDLGLCPHHHARIIGQPVAVAAPVQMQPATRASILAWLEQNAGGGST